MPRLPLTLVGLAAMASLSACATTLPPSAFADGAPQMRPEVFFAGETRSTGMIEAASGAPSQRMHVEGRGRRLADGRFELVQMVSIGDKPATTRTWVMTATGAHDYVATLTDASGQMHAEAFGNLLHLTYPMKGVPLGSMEQWMYLQPDGRTALNEAVVRVGGIAVRRISERISRAGGAQ